MKPSTKAIRFLETLANPEGPKADELIRLTPFQIILTDQRMGCYITSTARC